MVEKKLFKIVITFFLFINIIFIKKINSLKVEQKLKEIDYTESTETIVNPGIGYTSPYWISCSPKKPNINNPIGSLNLLLFCIGAYSSGYNGKTNEEGKYIEGEDLDLDEAFFETVRGTFENVRRNGGLIGIRFRYDDKGKSLPEPQTFDKVLEHMEQIKKSGILEDYKDIIAFVETGFVGAWGEQHSGKYTSYEMKAKTLEAVLNMVPQEISVSVRSPNTVAQWLNISLNVLDSFVSVKGTKEARVGMYNDGYMGSGNDLGTYVNRTIETDWMKNQMRYSYYGGEFSGDIEFAKKSSTYLPENSIPEMYKTHLSYINGNIFQLYKNYSFGKQYDVINVDNSAYYGQTVWKFIRDHLGYRLVLRSSEISSQVEQGGVLQIKGTIENTGFSSPIKRQKAEIILEKDGNYIKTDIDIDSTEWYSCSVNNIDILLKLPGEIEKGIWNVYFKLSIGKSDIMTYFRRSVKFANKDIWNQKLGANRIGSFTIQPSFKKAFLTDNYFYQLNSENSISINNGNILSINNIKIPFVDYLGSFDCTEKLLYAESKESKVYITNDDRYLYIIAKLDHNAKSPVVNLQIQNSVDDFTYWFYVQSNGFIYFNKGDYTGIFFKIVDKIAEFRISFGNVMKIGPGILLKSIRLSVQDSSNDWKTLVDIKNGEYNVTDTFNVYSSLRTVTLKNKDNFIITVETSLEEAEYQWYFNDKKISAANDKEYIIKKVNSKSIGIYSVEVKSLTGAKKKMDICKVIKVY